MTCSPTSGEQPFTGVSVILGDPAVCGGKSLYRLWAAVG